jgi:rRNA biogenesis protein RRP5
MEDDDDIFNDVAWEDGTPLVNPDRKKTKSDVHKKLIGHTDVIKSVVDIEDDDDDDEEDDDDDATQLKGKGKNKLRSRQKQSLKRRAEESTRDKELALENGTLHPESKDDFERLLIAHPNSSFLWVQYMAFYLQSAAIEPARAIAARALRTIDYRDEDVSDD